MGKDVVFMNPDVAEALTEIKVRIGYDKTQELKEYFDVIDNFMNSRVGVELIYMISARDNNRWKCSEEGSPRYLLKPEYDEDGKLKDRLASTSIEMLYQSYGGFDNLYIAKEKKYAEAELKRFLKQHSEYKKDAFRIECWRLFDYKKAEKLDILEVSSILTEERLPYDEAVLSIDSLKRRGRCLTLRSKKLKAGYWRLMGDRDDVNYFLKTKLYKENE